MNIAILFASSRYDGNTAALVSELEVEGGNVTSYLLKDYDITPFDYEHKNENDDYLGLVRELVKYDHVIFATPVYWYAMSSHLKIFFDRFSDLLSIDKPLGRKLKGQKCSVVSTGAWGYPPECFEEVFKLTFDYLGMKYAGMLYCQMASKSEVSKFQSKITAFINECVLTS